MTAQHAAPAGMVVVGSGPAAILAALKLEEDGHPVTLLCNVELGRHIPWHDVMAAGSPPAAARSEKDCTTALALVTMLSRMGVPFDLTPEGRIQKTALLGNPSVASAGAELGWFVQRALLQQLRASAVCVVEHVEVVEVLTTPERQAVGLVVVHTRTASVHAYPGQAVCFADGGLETVSGVHCISDAPNGMALAAAFKAGVPIQSAHRLLWHPACVHAPDRPMPLGLGSLRHGARLLRNGQDVSSLSPQGLARLSPGLLLDLSRVSPSTLNGPLISLQRALSQQRLTSHAPVPVVAAPWRSGGGLQTDGVTQATRVRGLFAAGPAAAMPVGSGELAGAALLHDLSSALRAAAGMAAGGFEIPEGSMLEQARSRVEQRTAALTLMKGAENPHVLTDETGDIMTAVLSSPDAPLHGADTLGALAQMRQRAQSVHTLGNALNALQLEALLDLSEACALAATTMQPAQSTLIFLSDLPSRMLPAAVDSPPPGETA
jgi:succinate dehydrogenase/fumarate reductase flavoprotein subunit